MRLYTALHDDVTVNVMYSLVRINENERNVLGNLWFFAVIGNLQ